MKRNWNCIISSLTIIQSPVNINGRGFTWGMSWFLWENLAAGRQLPVNLRSVHRICFSKHAFHPKKGAVSEVELGPNETRTHTKRGVDGEERRFCGAPGGRTPKGIHVELHLTAANCDHSQAVRYRYGMYSQQFLKLKPLPGLGQLIGEVD